MHLLRICFILLLTSFVFSAKGQINESIEEELVRSNTHKRGDGVVGVGPSALINSPNGNQIGGGVKAKVFLGKRFSLNTEIVAGKDYLHVGPSIIGVPLWYFVIRPDLSLAGSGVNLKEVFAIGMFMLTGLENFAFYMPINQDTEISAYIGLLRFGSFVKGSSSEVIRSVGLEFNKYFQHFVLSPYMETNISGLSNEIGYNYGIYFGYYIKRK